MNDIKRTTSLNNFLSFIFYFLFVNTIFSLYVGGFALWLFVFVVFLDRKFLISILTIKKKALFLLLSVFILSSIFLQPIVIFKVVFSYICVRYVFFTMKNNTFYWFHFFLTLNVFICIFQYILFVHAGYKFLDPTYISNALYGSYALTTGDTFAPGFFLEYRVSGLSREPAFLSSLILSAIILLFVQKGYNCAPSSPYFRFLIFIYLLGIVLTFSKVTLALALTIPVAYLLRKFLRALGPDIITILFLILVCIVVYYFYSFTQIHINPKIVYQGLSVYHRTIGYYVLIDMNVLDLLFGIRGNVIELSEYLPYIKNSEWWGYDRLIFDNSGISQLIIDFGLFSIIPYIFFLRLCNVDGYQWLLFLLLTINVNPLTSTSFVILSLVIVFIGWSKNENIKNFSV